MSQLMLDDEKAMSDINPFADTKNFFPPGTSRQYNDYKKHKPPVEEPEEEYVSPACGVLSKGLVDWGIVKISVRYLDLIPGRNIDHGFTPRERMDFDKSQVTKKEVKSYEVSPTTTLISITCLILLIAVL